MDELNMLKGVVKDMIARREREEENAKYAFVYYIVAAIGAAALISFLIYKLYRHLKPAPVSSLESDFEDDFDDDFFEDEDMVNGTGA